MFDAKKLLDAMMSASQSPSAAGGAGASDQGLGGLLGNVINKIGQTTPGARNGAPGGGQDGGGLSGMLAGAGGIGGLLGSVLTQATQGLQGAGRQVNQATGAGDALSQAFGKMSGGKSPGDLLGQAKDFAGNNPGATSVALGSLAALFLGTKAGRGLTVDAAKLGGLALVGGLAYQAYQNYTQGKPPMDVAETRALEPPPAASPFGETGDHARDNDAAILLLRAMIAAASADGVIDEAERAHIVGNLSALGLDGEAAAFLKSELAKPATPQDLAGATAGPEKSAEVYTAARLAIDPDTEVERQFLRTLAGSLGLPEGLVAQIDAGADAAKAEPSRPA